MVFTRNASSFYLMPFSSSFSATITRVKDLGKKGKGAFAGLLSDCSGSKKARCFCSDVSQENAQQSQARARTKSPSTTITRRDRVNSWLCTAYSTSESYNIDLLRNHFSRKSSVYEIAELPKDSSDVLRVLMVSKDGLEEREVFFFRRLGAFVCWNLPELERKKLKVTLKDFQNNSYSDELVERENEQLSYFYKENDSNLVGGDIYLSKAANEETKALEKYAFSNAMAISVKLAIWESALDQFVDSLKNIPEELQRGVKPRMSRKEVLQKLGELLSLRHQINLYSDLLMTPDFYWDREDLELLYNKTCNYLDVGRRTKVTNEKLNLCSEMVELLRSHLNEQHSLRLEWAIIALIAIEVVFEVGHWIEKYYPS